MILPWSWHVYTWPSLLLLTTLQYLAFSWPTQLLSLALCQRLSPGLHSRCHRRATNTQSLRLLPNLNLILAVSEHIGIIYHELTRQTVNTEKFWHFLDNLEVVLAQELAFVIGTTFHYNQQQVRKLLLCSPFLNPIKDVFSALMCFESNDQR